MAAPLDRSRRYDAVLFDFFGTLVEYERVWERIAYLQSHQLLDSWGHVLSYDAFVTYWAAATADLERTTAASCQEFSMLDTARAFCQCSGAPLSDDQCQQLGDTVVADWQEHVRAVPGVAEMIMRLAEHYRVGIVSNTHDPQLIPALLQAMGIADRFQVTVLSVDHGHRKPHPSIYQAALIDMGVAASRVLFVGDSHGADYVGPQKVGMAARLIDPDARHNIPSTERLATVLDVEDHLSARRR